MQKKKLSRCLSGVYNLSFSQQSAGNHEKDNTQLGEAQISEVDAPEQEPVMSGLNPNPPHVVHSSTRLTHAQAHSLLSNFLQNAENDAAYRPDSTLTDRGPQSASTGGTANLTLHHLKRILQGIEGKRVGGENTNTFFGDLAGANLGKTPQNRKKRENAEVFSSSQQTSNPIKLKEKRTKQNIPGEDANDEKVVGETAVEQDGWQDKDDYELAQKEIQGDVMQDEAHPAGVDQPANEEEAQEEMEVHVEKHSKLKGSEKAARKKAKQDRRKKDKQDRAQAKASGK